MKRFTLFVLLSSLVISAAQAAPTLLVYSVSRSGSRIGTMTTNIATEGDAVTVITKSDIEVKVIIVLYRFTQTTNETWKADQLISFSSKTDDNGTPHQVSVSASSKGILITTDGKTLSAPTGTLPTSFWSTRFLKAKALINNDNGSVTKVVSRNMGSEQITVGDRVHGAQHYKVRGENDFERDLWFEGEQLLRVQLKGSDGFLIISDLQQ